MASTTSEDYWLALWEYHRGADTGSHGRDIGGGDNDAKLYPFAWEKETGKEKENVQCNKRQRVHTMQSKMEHADTLRRE